MATIVNFTPNAYANFQFQPVLDGTSYTAVIVWNMYAQRYYMNLFTLTNQRVLTIPLIASPPDSYISLTAGYFITKLIYRASKQQFEIF